jgi:integrase
MATYLAKHDRSGWKYQRHLPKDLRPFLGNRSLIVRYIPDMSRRQAEVQARIYAAMDDEIWAKLRSLNAAQRALIVEKGGVDKVSKAIPELKRQVELAERVSQHALLPIFDPLNIIAIEDENDDPESLDSLSIIQVEEPEHPEPEWTKPVKWDLERAVRFREKLLRSKETAPYEELQLSQAIVAKIDPAPAEFSLEALCRLWEKVREPKHPRKSRSIVELLKTVIGDIPYNTITRDHIIEFREHMVKMGTLTRRTQKGYLSRLKSMFSAARSESKIQDNPVEGVNINGKPIQDKVDNDKPFTGAEIKLVLEKAAEIRFGCTSRVDRHEETMWALRVLAYTGARPGEVLQLRKRDVYLDGGVPIIYVRQDHEEQSVKTGQSRKVPIHPAISDFLDFAQSKDDFVFGPFAWNKDNKRVGWLTTNFRPFLVNVCQFPVPLKKSAYSFRHSFIGAMRSARPFIPDEIQHAIVGHSSDIHSNYGRGYALKEMAKEIARVDPLSV